MDYLERLKLMKKILKRFFVFTIVFTNFVCVGCGWDLVNEKYVAMNITVISPTTIELSWIVSNIDFEECIITKESPDSLVATYVFSDDESSFIDNQVIPGITYIYKIFINDSERGSRSINTLQPPTYLYVIVSNGEAIKLHWYDNNQIEDIYYIERKEESEHNFTIIDSLPTNSTEYLDYNLEHMKKYIYRVNSKIDEYYTEYTNTYSTGFHFGGLFVPTDYATIEEAFIAASPAEKVILEPGSYDGGIVFPSKKISLCSRFVLDNDPTHIENTVIDGQHQAIVGIEFPDTSYHYGHQGKVQGLTIQHCNSGAIRCLENTSPILSNLIIKDNITDYQGALYFENCGNPTLSNSLIYNNSSTDRGSAINLSLTSLGIVNCTIVNNDNNAIYCINLSKFSAYNTIIYNNIGYAIYMSAGCLGGNIFYSDIEGGEDNIENYCSRDFVWENSINSDPLFIDIENNDFHLQPDSPCIDTGWHLDIYLDVDGTRNDMGAYGGPNGNW